MKTYCVLTGMPSRAVRSRSSKNPASLNVTGPLTSIIGFQLILGNVVVEYAFSMVSLTTAVKTAVRVTALLFGFPRAWSYRFYIEPEGVNYFDIAHLYLRRDWNDEKAYWSYSYRRTCDEGSS